MDYKEYNDYELLYILNENEDASEILYTKYKGLIIKIANALINKFTHVGFEKNDLLQEGYLALYSATKTYDAMGSVTFFTYACKCIANSMLSILKKNNNKKNHILNNSISYNNEDKTYDDKIINIRANKSFDPINILLDSEANNKMLNELKGYEKDIAICKMLGFPNSEIASLLNIDRKAINNAVTRIKNKYKNS